MLRVIKFERLTNFMYRIKLVVTYVASYAPCDPSVFVIHFE